MITYCDIETASLPLAEIEHLKPDFKPPANYRDAAKIAENLKEQEAKWLQDGALSAITGKVLVIGTMQSDGAFQVWENESEMVLLQHWWDWFREYIQAGNYLITFCGRTFDLAFLARRAFKHGVSLPKCLWEGRYITSQVVDVAEKWAMGSREPRDRISLDNLSKFLGTGAKNGKGEDFAGLWATDKPKALEYLKNDLVLCKAAYERLYA